MKIQIALLVAAQMFSSCFGPKAIKQSHSGELTDADSKLSDRDERNDDSFFDEYKFEADQGMVISASLNSDAFDPYLHLLGPDGTRLADHDDISEDDNNSKIRCLAPERGEFAVIANSYGEGETGAYQLELETTKATDADSDLAPCGGPTPAPDDSASAEPPAAPSEGEAEGAAEVQVVP